MPFLGKKRLSDLQFLACLIELAPSEEHKYFIQRTSDIEAVTSALDDFYKKYSHYPPSQGWDGVYTKWGKATTDYIPGLVPEFLDRLPIDPRHSKNSSENYLYKSNGSDFNFWFMEPLLMISVEFTQR